MSDVIAGRIAGTLTLTLPGADPVELGTIPLPIVVTRIYNPKTGSMSFGLGVNLDEVKHALGVVFRDAEIEESGT